MFFCCFLSQVFASQTCYKTDKVINLNKVFGKTCLVGNSTKKSMQSNKTKVNITKKSEKFAQNEGNFSKTDKNDLLD